MRNQKGFTLIEVLIAVSLLAIISLLVWQSMSSAVGSKERAEKRTEASRVSSLAVSQMTRDLQVAVLFSSLEMLGVGQDGEQRMKSVFIGANNGDQDKLTFNSLAHVRYLKDTKESDLSEVSYFLEADSESETSGFLLKKREQSPPDTETDDGGATMGLLSGVKELNFRYFDSRKGEYVDEWDTTKVDFTNRLPRAVEITLVTEDPMDEEETVRFTTIVLLEMSPGPNDF